MAKNPILKKVKIKTPLQDLINEDNLLMKEIGKIGREAGKRLRALKFNESKKEETSIELTAIVELSKSVSRLTTKHVKLVNKIEALKKVTIVKIS